MKKVTISLLGCIILSITSNTFGAPVKGISQSKADNENNEKRNEGFNRNELGMVADTLVMDALVESMGTYNSQEGSGNGNNNDEKDGAVSDKALISDIHGLSDKDSDRLIVGEGDKNDNIVPCKGEVCDELNGYHKFNEDWKKGAPGHHDKPDQNEAYYDDAMDGNILVSANGVYMDRKWNLVTADDTVKIKIIIERSFNCSRSIQFKVCKHQLPIKDAGSCQNLLIIGSKNEYLLEVKVSDDKYNTIEVEYLANECGQKRGWTVMGILHRRITRVDGTMRSPPVYQTVRIEPDLSPYITVTIIAVIGGVALAVAAIFIVIWSKKRSSKRMNVENGDPVEDVCGNTQNRKAEHDIEHNFLECLEDYGEGNYQEMIAGIRYNGTRVRIQKERATIIDHWNHGMSYVM